MSGFDFVVDFHMKMSMQSASEPAVAQSVFHQIEENLYRLESSGGYYALQKRGGKQFRHASDDAAKGRELCACAG